MISHRDGKEVVICDGCFRIIAEKPTTKKKHFHGKSCRSKYRLTPKAKPIK